MGHRCEDLTFETLQCFESLVFSELDENWVTEQFDNGFTDITEYPYAIEPVFSEGVYETLLKITDLCEKWSNLATTPNSAAGDGSFNEANRSSNTFVNNTVLWTVLKDNDIEVKNLLCLIFLFCSRCVKMSTTMYEKEVGLICSKLYFVLIHIPGSTAYSIYHQGLYQTAINCLKLPKERVQGKKRPPTSVYRNDVVNQRKRVNRESADNEVPIDIDEGEAPEPNDAETVETDFNPRECEEIMSCFSIVLKALVKLLGSFSLQNDEELIELTVQKLVECTTCEIHCTELNFDFDVSRLASVERKYGASYVATILAYKALFLICQPLHGNEKNNYVTVFKHLMNHILCTKAKSQSVQTIPHKYQVIKDNAISFVCYNLKTNVEKCLLSSHILIQQMCVRVNEKSEYRAKVSHAVVTILRHFPPVAYAKLSKWLQIFVTHTKVQNRVFALEILSLLMSENQNAITKDVPTYTTQFPIANAIIARCSDKASTVRTKALALLAVNIEKILSIIKQEIGQTPPSSNPDEPVENEGNSSENAPENEVNSPENEGNAPENEGNAPVIEEPASDDEDELRIVTNPSDKQVEYRDRVDNIANMLHHRANDSKVFARKAALQALEKLICFDIAYLQEENLNLFLDAAADPNIAVRKQSVISVTTLLQTYNHHPEMQKCWLQCVLPLVLDSEKTVQSKALEVMEVEFLDNLNSPGPKQQCIWEILNEISSGQHKSQQRYLHKAFNIWKSEGKLRPNLHKILESNVGNERDSAAWFLLSILAVNIELRRTSCIVNYWESCIEKDVSNSTRLYILQVISYVCKHISMDKLSTIQGKLESDIMSFKCSIELIAGCIETLFKIYKVMSNKEEIAERLTVNFATKSLKVSEKFLSSILLENVSSNEAVSEDLINKHVFTIGELAQLCPSSVPSKIQLIIQSLITSSPATNDDGRDSLASCKIGRISGLSSHIENSFSPQIQAHAFVALGKLCLQNEDLAKKCVPALARELVTSKHFAIRNNVVIVMVDLCTRYTLLVDLYIPSISSCLKDCNPLVRYQTLILITRLLQQDYIKWKGTLFYRMLSTIIDEDKSIRSFAEYSLGYLMPKRQETIFVQHFAECIFYFNSYTSSNLKFVQTPIDMKLFSLKGESNKNTRMLLYKFMAKKTRPPLRIRLVVKLCNEILGAVADSVLPLDEGSESVVKDCLAVLSCDEIKLPTVSASAADDTDELDPTENLIAKTISQAQKVLLVQQIMPIVISLKKFLEELKSPLLNDLMLFLSEISKDYKNELKDIFSADRQLEKEIEFDIRRGEKQEQRKAQEKQNEASASCLNTPTVNASKASRRAELLMSSAKAKRVLNSLRSTPIQTVNSCNKNILSDNYAENA